MNTALKLVTEESLHAEGIYSDWELEKQEEFLSSKCDMFSYADFQYYAIETGKGMDWVRENAKYSDEEGMFGTCLENAMIDGDYDLAEFFI